MSGLLPPNTTLLERHLEHIGKRIENVYFHVADLWNPSTCPVELLPWLAWGFSVDYWNPLASETSKRFAVANAFEVHRRKGTVQSVRLALESLGLGSVLMRGKSGNTSSSPLMRLPYLLGEDEYGVIVDENVGDALRNGSIERDGTYTRGSSDHWATYSLTVKTPIPIAQAEYIRKVLSNVAPARCFLKEINYIEVANSRNGSIFRNGTFTRGVA